MMYLVQINGNLFGFLPEPLGMLIFGIGLVVLTVVLRRVLIDKKRVGETESPAKQQRRQKETLKEKLS